MQNIINKHSCIWALFALTTACEPTKEPKEEAPILSAFTEPFDKKGVNLQRILGDSMIIEADGKTNIYYINYTRAERNTEITDASGKLLFNGPVSRYRGLYYLTQLSPDSMFWIHAFELNDNKIKGFLQVEKQLRLLDDTLDYWLQTEEPAPQYITSATQNGISIIPNKQLLNYLFTYILEQLPYENIVEADAKAAIKNTTKAENDSLPMEVAEIILIKSMKPNPAVDALTLTFVEKDRYEIFITDMQGKNLLQEKCKCDELTLDVASLPRGNHLLTAVSKKEKQTLQLILQ